MDKEKIDWKEYRRHLLSSLSNERLWAKAIIAGEYNPHHGNITRLENEIRNLDNNNYNEIIAMYADTPDYFNDFSYRDSQEKILIEHCDSNVKSTIDKEVKIDMLLALLTSTIWKDRPASRDHSSGSPFVYFLSSEEVQIFQRDGCLPTNKVFEHNPLKDLLKTIVETYFDNEERHWLESWGTDNPKADYSEIEDIYDSTYSPEHIYHKLRLLKELIS